MIPHSIPYSLRLYLRNHLRRGKYFGRAWRNHYNNVTCFLANLSIFVQKSKTVKEKATLIDELRSWPSPFLDALERFHKRQIPGSWAKWPTITWKQKNSWSFLFHHFFLLLALQIHIRWTSQNNLWLITKACNYCNIYHIYRL